MIIEVSAARVIVGLGGAFVFDKSAALDGWLAGCMGTLIVLPTHCTVTSDRNADVIDRLSSVPCE